jgi:glycosyltransferase involved in cell wall biosynthesis
MEPKISVCIPTYNRANLLKQAIESVLSQTFTDFELLISDNASQDETSKVIQSFRDPRITYIRKAKNIGLVDNWNSCLATARGPYVTILSDDDLMNPDNLAQKVRALDKNKSVGLVHANFHIIDEKGEIAKERAHPSGSQDFVEQGLSFLRRNLLTHNQVVPPSPVIRKECFARLGGFSKAVHYTTDFEYWMRISRHYDIAYLGDPLMKYRMYYGPGWTSSEYLTPIEGIEGLRANVKGLKEEYAARKIILRQTKSLLPDWGHINGMVRRNLIDSLNFFIEKKFTNHGEQGKALRSIAQVCQAFPDLMFESSMARLIVKVLVGRRVAQALRGLMGKQVEGV